MPSDAKPSPFDERGNIVEGAYKNLFLALLLRLGGRVDLTWAELEASNLKQWEYERNQRGMVFAVITTREGHA